MKTTSVAINRTQKPYRTEDFDEEELSPAVTELKPKFTEERSRLRSERQRSLRWHYEIGTIVAKHYGKVKRERDKRNQDMYGEHFFDRLAELIPNVPQQLLYKCFKLPFAYDTKAFAELIKHDVITPTHALQLASLDDKKDRDYFESKIIEQKLTAKELFDAIKKKFGVRRKPGAGRPMKVPGNVTKALTHLNAQADNFIRCNENIWFGEQFDIIDSLTDLPSSLFTEAFKDQLVVAAETCDKLAEAAENDARKLHKMIAEVERRLAAQAECDRKAAEAEEDEEFCCAV